MLKNDYLKKHIAILGSTGSIGTQAIEVLQANPEKFELEVLTAQNNSDLLIKQAIQFKPNAVVIGQDELFGQVSEALVPYDIKVYAGKEAISQIVEMDTIDIVLIALVGYAGLQPTINAIKAKKRIALANKESLVVAGELVSELLLSNKTSLIPVDSEHSAIFQCLSGENPDQIEKIYLTASGGPFRNYDQDDLKKVTKKDALQHPNWNMGDKISIDSASLMNKGLEVIEAKWLFGLEAEQIEVVIHPQSIIHSLVQFIDGSIKAQMGLPDMRLPIQFALGYPERLESPFKRFDFMDSSQLTFEVPDIKKIRNLALAFEALKSGGNMPCILNAANEIVVEAFLNDRLNFVDMPDVIEKCMQSISYLKRPTLQDLLQTDKETRILAGRLI